MTSLPTHPARPGPATTAQRWARGLWALVGLGLVWTVLSQVPASTGTTGGAPPPSPRQGFSAPDFTLTTLQGDEVTLSALRGQVVVINLWASWCPPCRAEMPALENVHRAYKDQGLTVLAVNSTFQDTPAAAVDFLSARGLTFPVPLDLDGEVSRLYQLRALPSTYFVDRLGVIQSVAVGGPLSEAAMRATVEDLLGR